MEHHPESNPLTQEDAAVLSVLRNMPQGETVVLPSGQVMNGEEAAVLAFLMGEDKGEKDDEGDLGEPVPIMPFAELEATVEKAKLQGIPGDAYVLLSHAHTPDGRCGWVFMFATPKP